MKGRRFIGLALAFWLGASGVAMPAMAAPSATVPASKIAVLDYQLVMREAKAAKQVRRDVEARRKAYQKTIKSEEDALRKVELELKQQRAVLTPEAFKKRREEFEKKVIDLQRKVRDRTRALDQAFSKAMREIQKPLVPLVRELAKELGYNLVVDNAQILMVAKPLDITAMVIKRLDARLPKVDLPKSDK